MAHILSKTESGITYYRQIADVLAQRIHNGDYPGGGQLPSDRLLSQEFGHNRHTIRRALDLLEERQLIERHQGRGTFVIESPAKPAPRQPISIELAHLSQESNLLRDTQVVSITSETAAAHAAPLDIQPGDGVYRVCRLHHLYGEPVIVDYVYLSQKRFPRLETHNLSVSLWMLLQHHYRLQPARMEVIFESMGADRRTAELLQIALHTPVMLEKRIIFDGQQKTCVYAEQLYRGDRFSFVLPTPELP